MGVLFMVSHDFGAFRLLVDLSLLMISIQSDVVMLPFSIKPACVRVSLYASLVVWMPLAHLSFGIASELEFDGRVGSYP